MTHPSAPHTTAGSLSLRIQELERSSAAVPDLEAKLENMLRERDSMTEQMTNWDRRIESTCQQIKAGAEARRVLGVLTGQFTQLVDRETRRVIKTGNQKRVTRDQLRAYVKDHPWSRPVEIEEALGYGRNTASASLTGLVQLGEFQNVHGHYALVGAPMRELPPMPLSQRSRIRAHVAANPGQRMQEILDALGLTQSSSSNFTVLVANGKLVRKNKRYYPSAASAEVAAVPEEAGEEQLDVASEPEVIDAPERVMFPGPEVQEAAPVETPRPEPEVVPVHEAPVAAPAPVLAVPDDEELPEDEEALDDAETPDENAPESGKEVRRRLLPPRLSQDQRQVCEALAKSPRGMTTRLLASRLNWMQSRTDKVVNVLLTEGVLLKVASHVQLAPKYRAGVPRD